MLPEHLFLSRSTQILPVPDAPPLIPADLLHAHLDAALLSQLLQPGHHHFRQPEETASPSLGQKSHPCRRLGRLALVGQDHRNRSSRLHEPSDHQEVLRGKGIKTIDPDIGPADDLRARYPVRVKSDIILGVLVDSLYGLLVSPVDLQHVFQFGDEVIAALLSLFPEDADGLLQKIRSDLVSLELGDHRVHLLGQRPRPPLASQDGQFPVHSLNQNGKQHVPAVFIDDEGLMPLFFMDDLVTQSIKISDRQIHQRFSPADPQSVLLCLQGKLIRNDQDCLLVQVDMVEYKALFIRKRIRVV